MLGKDAAKRPRAAKKTTARLFWLRAAESQVASKEKARTIGRDKAGFCVILLGGYSGSQPTHLALASCRNWLHLAARQLLMLPLKPPPASPRD
jgi:hypothetical protein